ncbi:hypothetical protein Taro_052062 [Colocasia esculenta]|uniref:Putative plant transposon protein domain-containing protein n=1 Tax=Colocasia esculenta TaxID=4460 RepID=A0A843XIL6_COLES|nr:hypothetical protein [Colocasia esculenta]
MKKFKKYKKKAIVVAWNNKSDSDSESSSSEEEEEKANLAFMANIDDKNLSLLDSTAASGSSDSVGGYSLAFLTANQQERYSTVKIKLCGNKAVDLADLEKHEMHSVVEALQRLKWTGICTVSEPSYPHLEKAFYTCLKSEEDGSLTSTIKGTSIHITHDLLERLFGTSTVGHSLVESVDIHSKGLGIIGTEYKLKDGKIDINQFNAFNRILHFIVCQILVPRSATFSSCTKGDADMMFWAVQKQDINMAQIIIEIMKSAAEAIWDRKNKLAVRIEDIAPEHIEPIGQSPEEIIPPTVPAPAIIEEVVAEGAAHFEGEHEDTHIEETPNVPKVETSLKESHEDTVAEVVAPGHTEDVQMVDAPAQGEPEVQEEPEIQGEHTASSPADQFQEGLVEDTSDDNVEPAIGSGGRGKVVAPKVPLLTRKAHHRSRKKKIHVHIKPIIAMLNTHGEIMCSLQSDISSIFISQSTGAKEIGAVKSELQKMRNELGSLKKLITDLSDFVGVQLSAPVPPAPTQSIPEKVGPSEPSVAESGPPGPSLEELEPSGPCAVEDISDGPSGPSVQMESVAEPTGPQGAPLAFHRFLFREYQRGFIKSSVLAPLLSEAKRFVNTDWCKAYPEAAL